VYHASLTLFDPKERKVARGRVCPADRIYAVCGSCGDLSQVQSGPCPWCGARHMWEVSGMLPRNT